MDAPFHVRAAAAANVMIIIPHPHERKLGQSAPQTHLAIVLFDGVDYDRFPEYNSPPNSHSGSDSLGNQNWRMVKDILETFPLGLHHTARYFYNNFQILTRTRQP